MATTLTERYISATTDSLPPDTQGDVRAELEASIADAIESRLEQGEDPEEAERIVLTDLGDPAALAASYADRILFLADGQIVSDRGAMTAADISATMLGLEHTHPAVASDANIAQGVRA